VSYRDASGTAKPGVLINDRVFSPTDLLQDVAQRIDTGSVIGLLRKWDEVHPRLHAAALSVNVTHALPFAEIVLDAPVLYPGALFCAGANYWDHLREMDRHAHDRRGALDEQGRRALVLHQDERELNRRH
jgi:2-keto-4-pentenoate hydratase/2-oxohepta-3-ene-1,7-dioic acid hydratase in catechol pathway